MIIYIVRHGQTQENKQRILQGHMPGTLTEEGKEQVRHAAEELSRRGIYFKCVVTSDLKRAFDSAQIISDRLNLQVVPMEILRERDWGSYTGISISEAKDKYVRDGRWEFPITDNPAETEEQIAERAVKALDLLSSLYSDQNIIVVTHGMFARFMIAGHFECHYKEVTSLVNAEIRMLNL